MKLLFTLLIFVSIECFSASRYWVGGSGNWTNTNTVNWSATSGGTGGASVPTSADDAIFNANAGPSGMEVKVTQKATCKTLDCSAYGTRTLTLKADIDIYGGGGLCSGMTFNCCISTINFKQAPTTADVYFYTWYKTFFNIHINFTNTTSYYFALGGPNTSGGIFNEIRIDAPNRIGLSPNQNSDGYFRVCNFVATGSPGNLIHIWDWPITNYAELVCNGPSIKLDYVEMRGIRASGSAVFCAGSHSTNTQYNVNWNWNDCSTYPAPNTCPTGPSPCGPTVINNCLYWISP